MLDSHSLTPAELPTTLRTEFRGAVAVLTLARPEKRNALSNDMILGVERFFQSLDPAVRAVVIAADGDHFSAGLDLADMVEREIMEAVVHSQMWHRIFNLIESGSVPVVAALKGAVVGGGLELAAAAHIRVAERSTFYALPEGQRGLFVGGGAAVRVPRLIGVARTLDMMLTGRRLDADEGAAVGLSQYIVEDGDSLDKAIELAGLIANNAAQTNFAVIRALPRIAEANPAEAYFMEAMMTAITQGTDDARLRIREFLGSRSSTPTDR